jgi:DNA-binding SARP family transcriptional activator/Tfp pilus assembly protein PilF
MVTIHLLGRPLIWYNGTQVDLTRRKSRALLYFLATQTAPTSRDQLFALFWPDLDRPAAQQSLRTTLHGLRRALGDEALLGDGSTLLLAKTCSVDCQHLAQIVAHPDTSSQQLSVALANYRGAFLADFTLPDSPLFDEWVHTQREHYRQLAVRGLVQLAAWHATNTDWPTARTTILRAIELEPLQEDLYQRAMQFEYFAGNRVAAIRLYEQLSQRLDNELGVPPLPETRQIYDQIITDQLAREPIHLASKSHGLLLTPIPSPSTHPFAGRERELQHLQNELSAGKVMLIEGEPGIGKTRLVAAYLEQHTSLVLTATARELDQAIPYQPLIDALHNLTNTSYWPAIHANLDLQAVWRLELARILPDFAPTTPTLPPDEARLREAISRFLRQLSLDQPVTLFFDDLHWADTATLGLIGYLARRGIHNLALVLTARTVSPREPLAQLIQTLTREGRLARLSLQRLTEREAHTLASQLGASPDLVAWLATQSEGNPYVLVELWRHLQNVATPALVAQPEANKLNAPVVPSTLYSLVQSRLARLSDTARYCLDLAVAAGREFDIRVIGRAAALSDEDLYNALDELQQTGLAMPRDATRYHFDHSLTMEVAYREVGDARHRLLHRRVAEALEQIYQQHLDTVAGQIATHFLEGQLAERAVPYALQAGQAAARLAAWHEATHFYEIALQGTENEHRVDVLLKIGEAAQNAGDQQRGSAALREARMLLRGQNNQHATIEVTLALAWALFTQSRFSEIIALVNEVITIGDLKDICRAELIWGSILSVEGADLAGAANHLRRASALCDPRTDLTLIAQIRFELAGVFAQQGQLNQAVALYAEVLHAAKQDEKALLHHILAYNNLGYHLLLLNDPQAQYYAEQGLALARERGMLPLQPFLYSTLGEIAMATGDLAQAEAHFNTGLIIAEQCHIPERIAGITANLGLVALRSGDKLLAIHRLSTALAHADSLGILHLAAQIRIWLAPLLPVSAAREHLTAAQAIAEHGGRQLLLQQIAELQSQLV